MHKKEISSGISSTANFCSHRLAFTHGKVMVKNTGAAYLFYSIFAFIGLGIIIAVWCGEGDVDARLGITLFGMIFAGAGIGMIVRKFLVKLPEIDLHRRMLFPSGRKYYVSDMTNVSSEYGISLNTAEKIQISTRRVRQKNSSYTAYMLDLKFADGYCCRLLSHGNKKCFTEDAEKLAQVLALPLEGKELLEEKFANSIVGGVSLIVFGMIWTTILLFQFSDKVNWDKFQSIDFTSLASQPETILALIPVIFASLGVIIGLCGCVMLVKALIKRHSESTSGRNGNHISRLENRDLKLKK